MTIWRFSGFAYWSGLTIASVSALTQHSIPLQLRHLLSRLICEIWFDLFHLVLRQLLSLFPCFSLLSIKKSSYWKLHHFIQSAFLDNELATRVGKPGRSMDFIVRFFAIYLTPHHLAFWSGGILDVCPVYYRKWYVLNRPILTKRDGASMSCIRAIDAVDEGDWLLLPMLLLLLMRATRPDALPSSTYSHNGATDA